MDTMPAAERLDITRRTSSRLLSAAVHKHHSLSASGLSERAFTLAFSGLVYPQIWEDPVVDIEALALEPGLDMVTIASGGCNWQSYLTVAPFNLTAVDLNMRHVVLNRLKLAALRHLDSYDDFYGLFGHGALARNVDVFDQQLAQHLDPETLQYWNGRDWRGKRRIELFARGLHRHSLLGRYIASSHLLARMLGGNPRALLKARSIAEQREIFDRELRPLLAKPIVRRLLSRRSALFGLGIPPAQYDALCEGRPMHEVIEERLERLACGFDLKDNYFAWQAFNRAYSHRAQGPLPPYLQKDSHHLARVNAGNVSVLNVSMTDHIGGLARGSLDRYSLLDAPDWMSDGELNALWSEITRTARLGARVVFRTAGVANNLPGRVAGNILQQWRYEAEISAALTLRDRSAIYGGFHLYKRAQ
jgi:S-adenosylmethionine-diacylglycerol 3-amino-3-carboxypropyl transferase